MPKYIFLLSPFLSLDQVTDIYVPWGALIIKDSDKQNLVSVKLKHLEVI